MEKDLTGVRGPRGTTPSRGKYRRIPRTPRSITLSVTLPPRFGEAFETGGTLIKNWLINDNSLTSLSILSQLQQPRPNPQNPVVQPGFDKALGPPPPARLPIYCQPDVIKAMKTAWARTGNGTLGTEAGFVLNGNPTTYSIVETKSSNTQGSQKMTINTFGPSRTFALFHVHPLRGGRNPSTPDNNYLGNGEGDTGIADRFKIDFYVMHRNGLTMYDQKTKQTTSLRENLDWTNPCNKETSV